MSEQDNDDLTTVVAAWCDAGAIEELEARLEDSSHLKPMWERIRIGALDGRTFIGLPLTAKVTDDTLENHSRHLHSLLNLLNLPLTDSVEEVAQIEVPTDSLRPLEEPSATS